MFIRELTVFSLSYALSPLQVEWLLHTSRHVCQKRTALRGIAFLAAQCGCLYKHGRTTGFFRKCLGFCSWLECPKKQLLQHAIFLNYFFFVAFSGIFRLPRIGRGRTVQWCQFPRCPLHVLDSTTARCRPFTGNGSWCPTRADGKFPYFEIHSPLY